MTSRDQRRLKLPLWSPYHAYPDLQLLTREERRDFMRRLRRNQPWLWALEAFILLGTTGFAFASGLMGGALIELLIGDKFVGWDVFSWVRSSIGAIMATSIVSLGGLSMRDGCLKRAIVNEVEANRCACGYGLQGLAVENELVVCPECGEANTVFYR